MVGPVGLEPTTYGLRERPKPVGRVCDPLLRAWFVDAGWPSWTTFLTLVCHKCATGPSMPFGLLSWSICHWLPCIRDP